MQLATAGTAMTRYGWDASNHDWPRGSMDLVRARREGISLFTHKASEGTTFTDPYFDQAMQRAKLAGFPVVGGYHVLWPGNPVGQADYFLSVVGRYAPWWRTHPCFIFQTDAELFQEFRPYRQPTLAEIHAFSDRIIAKTGVAPTRVPTYAPEWLYGSSLAGLRYPLWASAYGGNPSGPFAQHAAADSDSRWHPYSGRTPVILQCGSNATIAGQAPCDINVIRVATDAQLQALFMGTDTPEDDLDATQARQLEDIHTWLQRISFGLDNDPKSPTPFSQRGELTDRVRSIQSNVGTVAVTTAAIAARQVTDSDLSGALTALVPTLTASIASAVTGGATDPNAIAKQVVADIAQLLKGAAA